MRHTRPKCALAIAVSQRDGNYAVLCDANANVTQLIAWASTVQDDIGKPLANDWHADRLVARYEYDPYGNAIGPDTDGDGDWHDDAGPYAETNPIRFSTKYWDAEIGCTQHNHRYYSPTLGRFLNRDPIGEEGGLALYLYAVNSPTGRTDPLGLMPPEMPPWQPGRSPVTLCAAQRACCVDECELGDRRCQIDIRVQVVSPAAKDTAADMIWGMSVANSIKSACDIAAGGVRTAAEGSAEHIITAGTSGVTGQSLDLATAVNRAMNDTFDTIDARGYPLYIWYRVKASDCESVSCRVFWDRNEWRPAKTVSDGPGGWMAAALDHERGSVPDTPDWKEGQAFYPISGRNVTKTRIREAVEEAARDHECGSEWEVRQ